MNLLTDIKVKGEVFCEYAFLSFEFLFENNTESTLSAEYRFLLPEGAVVSGMKIIDDTGRVITASVVSLTHGTAIWESSDSAVLRRIDQTTYSLCLGGIAKGGCCVSLKVYAPIGNSRGRLSIPLATGGSGGKCRRHAEIELLLRGWKALDAVSASHKIEKSETPAGPSIKTGKILADRDFQITFGEKGKVNSAIAVSDTFGGEMLCRLYPDAELFLKDKTAYRRLMLLYDNRGSLAKGASAAARELICEMADNFDGETAVTVIGEKAELLTDGFLRKADLGIEKIFMQLSDVSRYGDIGMEAKQLAEIIDEDTLAVLICGSDLDGSFFYGAESELAGCRMCIATLGAYAESREADRLAEITEGAREHIYGEERIKTQAEELLRVFAEPKISKIEVYSNAAETIVITDNVSESSGITVYAKYIGTTPPREFELACGGRCVKAQVLETEVYKSFAPVGLVCAEHIYSRLCKKLTKARPSEIQKIRMDMESVGVRLSALNAETALAAVMGGGKPRALRVVMPASVCAAEDAFDGRELSSGRVTLYSRERTVPFVCA